MLIGCLIVRSTLLLRVLGNLLMIDAVGWSTLVVLPLAITLFPTIPVAAGLVANPLSIWLVVVGVNTRRPQEHASRAREVGVSIHASRPLSTPDVAQHGGGGAGSGERGLCELVACASTPAGLAAT